MPWTKGDKPLTPEEAKDLINNIGEAGLWETWDGKKITAEEWRKNHATTPEKGKK